jgi:hypothetical protein
MFEEKYNLDDTLAVKFYKKSVLNKIKTKEKGRKIFEDVEYVSIKAPFDQTSKVDKPVTEEIKQRFNVLWGRYKLKNENKAIGTPLDLLTFLSPAQADNLKVHGVETVEQLAVLSEQGIKQIVHGRDLVNKAKHFLEGEHYIKKLEKENEELKKEIENIKKPKRARKIKNDVTIDSSECK